MVLRCLRAKGIDDNGYLRALMTKSAGGRFVVTGKRIYMIGQLERGRASWHNRHGMSKRGTSLRASRALLGYKFLDSKTFCQLLTAV